MGLLIYIALQNSSFDETLINCERGIILHKTEEVCVFAFLFALIHFGL